MSLSARPPATALLSLLYLFLFLFLLLPTVPAVPLSHHDPAPETAWAAHLLADRFTLVPGPEWSTNGYVPPPRTRSRNQYSLNVSRSRAYTINRPHTLSLHSDNLQPTARTKSFPPQAGDGHHSLFEVHVLNVPSSINIDPVIAKCQQIVEEAWVSSVVVKMKIVFTDLGDENLLARGGGTYFVKLPDLFDTILPVAAAESIRGKDLNQQEAEDGKYDVLITMNSRTPWYDGTDGKPPADRYDLVTVLLHEVYHNLVFAGSIVAQVRKDPNAYGGVYQTASLHKDYRTRFDSFLANKQGCAVLGYLTDDQLSQQLNRSKGELLADACTNGQLYFQHGSVQIAHIFSPRVFKARSSVYHLDPNLSEEDSSLMFPTITRGTRQHTISTTIRNIQAATLRIDWHGANNRCTRPLLIPIAGVRNATDDDFVDTVDTGFHSPYPHPRAVVEDNVRRIAGLPVWAFALLIVLAILLALLALAICLALLLRRRKKTTLFSSTSGTSKYPATHSRTGTGTGTGTGTSSRLSSYIPGVGGKASSERTHSHGFGRSHSGSKHSFSKHTTSKHTSSKHTGTKSETDVASKRDQVCPSSGKYVYICKCKCCCKSLVTRPPPVLSVHTFDTDSVPSPHTASHKHIHSHKPHSHHHTHTHKHSATKTLKKSCKSKSLRSCHHGCHCCYCCKYKPSSSKSSSKCTKSLAASSSKCETLCKSSSKCDTLCKSSSKCDTLCKSSSKCDTLCKSSSKCDTLCKSSSKCETCRTSTKCSSSRATPPSTKPPSTKPPSTRQPSSCKPSSSSCKPSSSAKTCCKSAASGGACSNKCQRIVEINVGYRC